MMHSQHQQLMQSPGQRAATNRVASFSRSRQDHFLHREVDITFGQWKGYKGRCVGTDEVNARIEIVAQENRRIVILPKEKVFKEYRHSQAAGDAGGNAYLNGMAAPFAGVTRTPAHAPGGYPFATPVHQPSMPTPQRMSTPVHTSYNPMPTAPYTATAAQPPSMPTPNMYAVDANASASYPSSTPTPSAPGEAGTPVSGLLPPPPMGQVMKNARTPGDEYDVRTAGTGTAFTPSDTMGFTPSDTSPYDYSPSGGVMTPYGQVQTPGTTLSEPGAERNASGAKLGMFVGLLVRLVADASKAYRVATVSVEAGTLVLEGAAGARDSRTVALGDIAPVKPDSNAVKEKKRVRIIEGPDAGVEGTIITVSEEENEAIINTDGDVKINSLDSVCLLAL